MSTPDQNMKRPRRKPVDIVTGPIPTVDDLVKQDLELQPLRKHMSNQDPEKSQFGPIASMRPEDVAAAIAAQRWLAEKWRRSVVRWQIFTLGALGYGMVITYLWANS